MGTENVWADPRTWIAIGSLAVGFLGFLFGILSFQWNRHESRLESLGKILQPMFSAAQQMAMAKGARQRCEQIKRSFPSTDPTSDAAYHLNTNMGQYKEFIEESVKQFRTAEAEFASRSFRFPDKVSKLVDKAMKSLSAFGRSVNDGQLQKATLQQAGFMDDYAQISREGRGWRLADPFEWLKKKFQSRTEKQPPPKYDISDEDMDAIMGMVHKRVTTQAHTGFAVHAPKKLLEHPDILKSEKIVEELDDTFFVVAFKDGASRMMTLVELMVFTFNLLQLAHETIELNRIVAVTSNVPQHASVSFTMSIDEIMRPKMVRELLETYVFAEEPSDADDTPSTDQKGT